MIIYAWVLFVAAAVCFALVPITRDNWPSRFDALGKVLFCVGMAALSGGR